MMNTAGPDRRTAPLGRRRFLALAGMGVAVVALGPAARALTGDIKRDHDGARTSHEPQRLSDDKLLSYRDLVETVSVVPGTLVVAGTARGATELLRKRDSSASPAWRSRVETVVASLDEPAGRRFVEMDNNARLIRLRTMLGSPEAADRDAGLDAVALATAPFHPEGFRWSRSSVDLWAQTLFQLPLPMSS